MTNEQKLVGCFSSALGVDKAQVVDSLQYNTIPEWDSVAHMTLIADLEGEFDVMIDTDQIIEMSSVAKVRDILKELEVRF